LILLMVQFAEAGFFAGLWSAKLTAYQPDQTSRGVNRLRGNREATEVQLTAATQEIAGKYENLPDMKVSIRQLFGIDSDMEVPAYSKPDEHVPELDPDYRFARPTTLAILAGFAK